MYYIEVTRQAEKDMRLIERSKLKDKAAELLNIIHENPYQNPPPYEKLRGSDNRYSRRINEQHRLVYEINGGTIKILRMWTHYERI
ncbi:MAG: Txe/YoeB family addiction module toxin [Oscillospiraceae bacterium]|jgi:Txe/YoeB family toxin of toxin-antitoxin system|nr:Txe/YoeB family addiction module toxin [Oscillospiraceae bacterium]